MCATYTTPVSATLSVIELVRLWGVLCLLSVSGLAIAPGSKAIAQVIPDGSLSTTVTSVNELNFDIEGGDRAGNHLFHSFDQFSIPTNGSARFNNDISIDTIISRVTGGQLSTIDGLIQANGTADLFLINPSGVMFGSNARLDIGGSLITTTAESVVFADGIEFNATDPTPPPLLSISTPIGLQMGINPGSITLVGPGHTLTQFNDFSPISDAGESFGLEVLPDQIIGLIGGDIRSDGAGVIAPNGQIELGSVRQGFVGFTQASPDSTTDSMAAPASPWQLDYGNVEVFGDIHLSGRSLLNVSGTPAGDIRLWGDRIQIESGAILLSQNSGLSSAGAVNIYADTRFTVTGMAAGSRFRSAIQTDTSTVARGSDINIRAPVLTVQDRGAIAAFTFGPGRSGNINIDAANRIDILGGGAVPEAGDIVDSIIGANSVFGTASARAGNIQIQTEQLNLAFGNITTSTLLGQGSGGNIAIDATDITLSGMNRLTPPGISAATLGDGQGGNVRINTENLVLQGTTIIDASTIATGNAGNVSVQASNQIMIGSVETINEDDLDPMPPALISSTVTVPIEVFQFILNISATPSGQGGNVRVATPHLRIISNGGIATTAETLGIAGTIRIDADVIELLDGGGIFVTNDNGEGGDITVNTRILHVDNGEINASISQSGRGSSIVINASRIDLVGGGRILAINENRGSGGDITLSTDILQMDNGFINASISQAGRGGNITIQASERVEMTGQGVEALGTRIILPALAGLFEPDNVTQGIAALSLQQGQAGEIDIQTNHLLLREGSLIATVAFNESSGGNISIQSDRQMTLDESLITTSTFGQGRAGNMNVQTAELFLQNGSQLLVSTGGAGQAGNLVAQISRQAILDGMVELGRQSFSSGLAAGNLRKGTTGNGGDLALTAPLLLIRNGAALSVSTLAEGSNRDSSRRLGDFQAGNIQANIGTLILDNGNITARSAEGEGGNITLNIGDRLLLQNQSTISTQAGTEVSGGGNGGNMIWTVPFVIATNNSDIVANAFAGNGGNIQIATQGLFGIEFRDSLTPVSDITASSTFGTSGTVTIQTPDADPTAVTTLLPSTPTDETQQITTGCETSGSQFVVTGRGGVPLAPSPYRPWTTLLEDLGTLPEPDHSVLSQPVPDPMTESDRPVDRPVQEATQMAIAPDGSITLVAASPSTATIGNFSPCSPSP